MAAKKGEARILVTLACTQCKERNYVTHKNNNHDPERMEIKKYCPRCRDHVAHKESK
jgi:large subunit ribosomal protein L33